jgi:DNA-binding NarL/FixJ family response regulator
MISVLIADDHIVTRMSLSRSLNDDPRFNVIATCENGADAIVLAGEKKPDIIILDINLNPVNGFEATRKIYKLYPGIKIIVYSLYAEGSYPKNMLQAGAKAYVTKGSDISEIYEAIITVMNNKVYLCKELNDKGFLKSTE